MLIDTHFHLDLMDNMQLLIKQSKNVNVGIMAVGTTPLAYKQELRFVNGANAIKVGLGLHPQLVKQRHQEIDLFLNLFKEAKFIGEVGLDFNKEYEESKEMQLICFQKIVRQCAIEGEKYYRFIVLNLQKQLLKFYEKQEHLTIVNVYFIGLQEVYQRESWP